MEGSWWRNLQKKAFIVFVTNIFFFFLSLCLSFFALLPYYLTLWDESLEKHS